MATGSIEVLRSGFRARVYAGKDPITGKQSYVCGQVWRDRSKAEDDRTRLLTQIEAGSHPDRAATVAVLMEAWAEVAEHELTTRETTTPTGCSVADTSAWPPAAASHYSISTTFRF